MTRTIRRPRQSLVSVYLFLTCILSKGCSCDPPNRALRASTNSCVPQHQTWSKAAPLAFKTNVPGTMQSSFSMTHSGGAAIAIPLDVVPGRGASSLTLSYDSSNLGGGPLGPGFSIQGADAITRCPKTMALDGEIRAVQYDNLDSLCVFRKRLVVVADHGDTIDYATWPDAQIKVVRHFEKENESYFEAFLPTGSVIEYGKTAATRPLATRGVPQAWLAAEMRDPRGNATTYGYCFANSNGTTVEFALDEIRYSSVDGDAVSTRAVAFVYGRRDTDAMRTEYSRGMVLQHSLQLQEVQMFAPGKALAYRYEFGHEQSEATGRDMLTSVQECGADGACKIVTDQLGIL